MRRTWGVVVVLALVVVSSVGVTAQTDETDCPVEVDETPDEPGEELADVVGEQQLVVARELERRGFNATLANASSPEERATVVATELDRIEVRLSDLEACRAALVEAREDGDLAAKEYRQRAATLEGDVEDVSERLNRAEMAATDLSPRVREQNDIDEERFDEMVERVDGLETFVAEPNRAIESGDDGNEQTRSDPKRGGSAETEPTEPRDTVITKPDGDASEEPTTTETTTTTEPSDDGNGTPDDENESPSDGPETGTSYG